MPKFCSISNAVPNANNCVIRGFSAVVIGVVCCVFSMLRFKVTHKGKANNHFSERQTRVGALFINERLPNMVRMVWMETRYFIESCCHVCPDFRSHQTNGTINDLYSIFWINSRNGSGKSSQHCTSAILKCAATLTAICLKISISL